MFRKLFLAVALFVNQYYFASGCATGLNFKPSSFNIESFPPTLDTNLMLPQVVGYFKELTTLTSYRMNLYDEGNNLMSWDYQARGPYPPGQISIFGDWIHVKSILPQTYTGEIILLNMGNQVACYSYSFRLFKVS
jgi:hypothetical protein